MFDPSKHAQGSSNVAELATRKTKTVSAAVHLARVVDARHYISKAGNSTLELAFEIIGPRDPDRGQPILRQHYSFSEGGSWKPAQLTIALNEGRPRLFEESDPDDVREALFNKPVAIRVKHEKEKYNNGIVTREKVDFARQPNAREIAALREEYGDSLVPCDDDAQIDAVGVGDTVGVEAEDDFNAEATAEAVGDFSEDEIPF